MSNILNEISDLGAKRQSALEELERITDELRPLAVQAVLEGEKKLIVASTAFITRPTLDKWIAGKH
jgi:hypothetical protein